MLRTYLCHLCTIWLGVTVLIRFILLFKHEVVYYNEPDKLILVIEITMCLAIIMLAAERTISALKERRLSQPTTTKRDRGLRKQGK